MKKPVLVGIDVSARTFEVAIDTGREVTVDRFDNDASGHKKLVKRLARGGRTARVALEAIKAQKVAELASEYEAHVGQINTWKKQAAGGFPGGVRPGRGARSRARLPLPPDRQAEGGRGRVKNETGHLA